MSPTFPLKIVNKASSTVAAPSKKKKKKKLQQQQQESLRSPLHLLNDFTTDSSSHPPTGCLRFFLSNSSKSTPPNPLNTSPKSTPNSRLLRSKPLKDNILKSANKENSKPRKKPTSTKLHPLKKTSPYLFKWHPGNKPTSKLLSSNAASSNSVDKFKSKEHEHGHSLVRVVGDKYKPAELNSCSRDSSFTPLRTVEIGSGSDPTVDKVEQDNSYSSNSKTPPVQASISPEIQCGSSVVSKVTPVCYGAGYVVSGVSDKRKCRPRGILIVGENSSCHSRVKAIGNLDSEEEEEEEEQGIANVRNLTDSIISKAPSPIEASMNWLLSPCNEEDEDQKEDSENASHSAESLNRSISLQSLHSPLSVDAPPPDIPSCCIIKLVNNHRRNSNLFISPNQLPEFQGFLEPLSFQDPIHLSPTCTPPNRMDVTLKKRGKQRYEPNGEISPFSVDSLGSENVIQTPQSDSGSAQKVCSPWLTTESCEKHDVDSLSELLSLTNVSSGSPKAIMNSTDLNFQFDCLATISNSMDLNQFQKILDDQAFWNSHSSSEDVSHSRMRVSWREGLMSRIYEMDEFDSCRCLSDEEEAVDSCSIDLSDILQAPLEHSDHRVDPIVTNDSGSPKLVIDEQEASEKCKEMLSHQIPCSCAESISTDGGGLAASGDSDWNLCYKNGLFDF